MVGVPDGWTDVPGVKRTARLRALGNIVVPQQALAALALFEDFAGERGIFAEVA